jgi:hypothetical protein
MYDKLALLTKQLIARWTAKSPRTYRTITDIALGVGVAATALTLLPITLPVWVLPASAFLIALGSKLTVDE